MYGGFARAGAAVAVSSEADRSGRTGGRRCARYAGQYGTGCRRCRPLYDDRGGCHAVGSSFFCTGSCSRARGGTAHDYAAG